MNHRITALVAGILMGAGQAGLSAETRVVETADATSLAVGGETLWTYHHASGVGKPYFHPLAATGGTVFSDLRPKDHPWHYGLWFSWKLINGVNYWEEDRETGRPVGGFTRLLSTDRKRAGAGAVRFDQELEYAPGAAAAPVLQETRVVEMSAPDGDGNYTMDWSATFRARDREVVLDRTPVPGEPGGKEYGGYAGLSVRMNREMGAGTFVNSHGAAGRDAARKPAAWMLFGKPGGGSLLFLDHPGNLRHPAKWYLAEGMPYFSPAVIHDGPHTLAAGASLTLRYRIVVSAGVITPAAAAEEWSRWKDAEAAAATRVLIVTGSNNHDWKQTTPVLRKILEETGDFEVTVTGNPETLTGEILSGQDVVLSNWNAFGRGKPAPWPDPVRQAYVDFVRNGGGHVVVHAGSSSYHQWMEYQDLCLATWEVGRTGHKSIHEFDVRMTGVEHPVTRGMKGFRTTDELWYRPGVRPGATVLAESFSRETGHWEPTAFVGTFGKGRCFTLLLGHDPACMNAGGFRSLLQRGTAWAGQAD